jgi:DNA-binding NarL/FixJ family response regulator
MAVTAVDDHAGLRAWVREVFEVDGYRVIGEADAGATGLSSHERIHPEVVPGNVTLGDPLASR